MKHVMIDIETLGVKEDAVIATLAAVEFDFSGFIEDAIYFKIDIRESIDLGRTIDAKTMRWWKKQEIEAIQDVFMDFKRSSLETVLIRLKEFISPDALIWANSPQFDLRILSHAYESFDEKAPWEYWQERDFRTVKKLLPPIEEIENKKAHNAYHDCTYQIRYLIEICKKLNITPQ